MPKTVESTPSKVVTTVHGYDDNGNEITASEVTYEAQCSVEIGATAKGEVQIKSVKVYAENADDAADQALATFRRIQSGTGNEWCGHGQRTVAKGHKVLPIGSKEAAEAVMGKSDAVMAQEAALGREWATDDAVENS